MSAPIVEWQILAADPDGVAAFYGALFGWEIDSDNPLGYRRVVTPSATTGGGIWPAPPQAHNFVQLFAGVDDVQAYFQRACELGATPLVPPQILPEGDLLAILQDPFGMPFGIRNLTSDRATP
jgi:predicted enzyme related to lactoylglutathione lyase